MANESSIVLNVPFDEPAGATVAYDYSNNRADGSVAGAGFVSGRKGNCIEFGGQGSCQISKNVIPITGNFTLIAWVMRGESPDGFTGKQVGFWFAWDEVSGYRAAWVNLTNAWNNIAVVKSGLTASIYLNEQVVETLTLPAQPTGFAMLQDMYSTDMGYGLVDELKAYSVALSPEEIGDAASELSQLNYLINGENIKDMGITVSESNGLFDLPKMKTPFSVDWPDYHGEVVDLTDKRVVAREIELKCWMKADNKMDFVTKVNKLVAIFQQDGTQRLTVDIHPTKPLIYEVYCESGIVFSKRWRSADMIGEFSLKLKEPQPVKRILRHQRLSEATKTITITMSTLRAVTISWGDGKKSDHVYGENITVSHAYSADGVYYVVLGGVIEEITNFSTNGIVVWSKI
jgi:hypothetical protein